MPPAARLAAMLLVSVAGGSGLRPHKSPVIQSLSAVRDMTFEYIGAILLMVDMGAEDELVGCVFVTLHGLYLAHVRCLEIVREVRRPAWTRRKTKRNRVWIRLVGAPLLSLPAVALTPMCTRH